MAIYSTNLTVSQPAKLCAAENPIVTNIQTDQGVESYSQAYFRVDDVPNEGNNLTITFNLVNPLYSKTFYAKNYPNQDNYFYTEIITNSTGQTIYNGVSTSECANSLYEALSNDVIISKYYHVNYPGGVRVYLKAKEASPKYNLIGHVSSSNTNLVNIYYPSSGSSKYEGNDIPEYNVGIDLYKIIGNYNGVLSSGDKVTELSLPFSSSDNINRFDLSSICKTFVNSERIDYDLGGYTLLLNYLRAFQFHFFESYPLIEGSSIKRKWQRGSSGIFWVCNAANDYTSTNDLTHLTGTTLSNKIYDVEFLTNSPAIKKSYRTQKEGLYFLVPENIGTSLKLYGNIEFYDGSVSNNNFLLDFLTSSSNSGGTYAANAGFEILGFDDLELAEQKKIRFIDYYVLQTTVGSEKFTNNSFTSDLSLWHTTSDSNATWFYQTGSATATLGTGTTLQVYTAYTFNNTNDFEGWYNSENFQTPSTGGTRPDWSWSSGWGGSMKMTTVDIYQPKNLTRSIVTPNQPFSVTINYASTFFLNTPDLEMNLVLLSGATTIYNQQFSDLGLFSPTQVLNITNPAIYNSVTSMSIFFTSMVFGDYNAGDNVYIQNVTVTLLNSTSTVYTTKKLTKLGLSLLSYPHQLTANATFASGSGNKLFLNLKDINGNAIGSTITLVNNNAGTFTGGTTISAANSPNVYSTEFWISGQTGVQQSVKINEVSLKPVIESNEYSKRKKLEFPYQEPDSIFQVAFLSKWGVFETFCFIGVESEDLEPSRKNYNISLSANDDGSYSQGFKSEATYQVNVRRKITVNSGLLDFSHYTWLEELVASPEIYEIREDNSINYLLLDSVKYNNSNQDNQFSWEATFIQTIYTNTIGL